MTSLEQSYSGYAEQADDPAASLTIADAIANLHQTADSGLRYYAAWWIGRFRVREPAALEALIRALADETDRAPDGGFPLRRNAARALGKVGDAAVVPSLVQCLDCEDYYVREAAVQSLGMIAEPGCISAVVALLAGGVAAAVKVPGKPHLAQPYNAILETLGKVGGSDLVPTVAPFLSHSVPQVSNAAARAMYQLTGDSQYAEQLVAVLGCHDLQLRRAALMDLGEMGYLPAASAIASTLAENSMKLIALKGVLEAALLNQVPPLEIDAAAAEVMALMDGLL